MCSQKPTDRRDITKYFPYSLILAVFAALLFHSHFSFCQSDESFYCALLHRLYLGESLIVDEWHPIQFYSPILLPFYVVYKAIVSSGDGVILFFRYLYVFICCFVALLFFSHIRKTNNTLIALFASLLILLYSRANIQGCSYYNLFLQFTLLSVIFFDWAKKKTACAFLAGITVSLASLCNPYFFILVLPVWIALYVWLKAERKLLIWIAFGAVLMFGIYAIFLFSRISLPSIMNNIGFLFHDPAHESTLFGQLKQLFKQSCSLLPEAFHYFFIVLTVYAFLLGKRGIALCRRHLITYCGCILLFILKAVLRSPVSICFGVTYPFTLALFPLFVYRIAQNRFDFPMFLYCSGLFSSVSFFFASNTVLDAMTVGFTISTAAGFLLLASLGSETITSVNPKHIFRFTLLVSVIIVSLFCCHRFLGIYRDAPLQTLTEPLVVGPAAGLRTTPEHAEEYLSLYKTITEFAEEYPQGQVMIGKIVPWMYLCCNWGYGSPSAWSNKISEDRLKDYYELHPNMLPQFVFLVQPYVCSYETVPFNNHAETNTYNINSLEGWFWETYLCKAELMHEDHYVSVYRLPGYG